MGTGSTAAIEAYDIDPADVDALLDRFGGTPWPAFSWQMPDGDEVYLVFCNFEHDAGIHYLYRRPHWDSPRLIATLFHDGPAIRWPDARQLTGSDFLLQLPAVGGVRPDAEELIVAALDAVRMPKRGQHEVANDLLETNRRRGG